MRGTGRSGGPPDRPRPEPHLGLWPGRGVRLSGANGSDPALDRSVPGFPTEQNVRDESRPRAARLASVIVVSALIFVAVVTTERAVASTISAESTRIVTDARRRAAVQDTKTSSSAALAGEVAATTRSSAASGPASSTDYLAELRASFTPENRRYAGVRHVLAFAEPFVGIGVSLLILFSGLAWSIRDVAARVSRRRYVQVLVVVTLFGLAAYVLEFPLVLFRDFIWEHRFGLSTQTLSAWLIDEGKGLALGWVVYGVTGLVALGTWIVAKAGR